jgi:hypothetical protein
MAYPSLALSRRNRRRRWLLIALLLVILAAITALAVRYRTERRGVADYFAVADEVVATHDAVAADLADVMAGVTTAERPEVLQRLANLEAETAQALQDLDEVAVPASVAEAHGYLLVATRLWGRAVGEIDDAFVMVLDQPNDPSGQEMLLVAFDELRVGDEAYAQFVDSLDDLDADLVTRDFGPVAYAGTAGGNGYDPQLLTLQLLAAYNLGEHHDISVKATTDPAPVGERDAVPVVPYSEGFVVQAVVANEGNSKEEQIEVTLELIARNGEEDSVILTGTVESLEPGEASTLAFDSLILRPGGLYELIVSTAVAEDIEVANDAWQMVFYRNENA